MLITIPQLLDPQALQAVCKLLNEAGEAWVDGRVTAGYQGAPVKFNQQIDERSELAQRCQHIIVSALERHPRFISAALPNLIYPPMFNRYGQGMNFGAHVDGSVRIHPHNGRKLRTDVSATLFLADPADYDGGELQIEDTYGMHSVKLAAGDMVLYPATSLHTVTPVTRGVRMGCFFWVQSLVRDDAQRQLLFEMDNAIQRLNQTEADALARRTLVGCYHNLLRQWSDT
ncbi:Fe(II)-dependent oxygenase [Herbaspirillum rubrisubalbicans]|uniref:Fe(II)-dependent oxygenase n=2 Tax=Herbaspirillum rubrisubalbicans TaxID=80842 RepID=A0ABX9C383_9BURK|nr:MULTISPECIES: Fe2+-dependent dioxygenase [Herbaspirillum]NQE48126.1 Fe(II)-dependent oxygenase [Herbaspirillum rubrisubalbicans]QJQ02295.1 Fe2+-dependent dioxygenase [Herbaspirillum rubrisubalbicans Os34]RAM64643.1 Fe(II)-dependent oxygenase [Herbaspirillum rubrisubalbicans]RAN49909.1 Fe(II)-dependent oxygenase [Herbaspirillum rubrisubalbicans]